MDMVTWTMKREQEIQRESKRESEQERERERDGLRKGMKHNMSSLSICLPATDLGVSVPKQTYLELRKEVRARRCAGCCRNNS